MATKIQNKMKVQIWRDGLSAKLEGTCLGATIEAFRFLNVEQQKRALEKMQESHNLAIKRESERLTEKMVEGEKQIAENI